MQRSASTLQTLLADAPEGERRKDAAEEVDQLSVECPPVEPTTTAVATPEFPVAGILSAPKLHAFATISQRSYRRTVGWVAVGTGVIATAAAGHFLVATIEAKHDTDRATTADRYFARSDAMYRDSIYGAVFGGTAVVAIGAGIYALMTAESAAKPKHAAWSITASPRASSVEYRWEF